METALATVPWQTFTQEYWQVEALRLEYAPRGASGPVLRAIVYADRKRRLLLPPYQPYAPLEFKPTPTEASYRIQRQWLQTARLLVDDMLAHGLRGGLTFSPAVTDPRPWIWSHFRVSQWFTNFIDFPFTLDQADRVVRQQANKASAPVSLARGPAIWRHPPLPVRIGKEERVLLRHQPPGIGTGPPVARSRGACGSMSVMRRAANRPRPGSSSTAGGRACDWIAGTGDRYLHSGVTQWLMSYMFEDLQQAGAGGYDWCGAGDETVALAKTAWGGRLMTEYSIEDYNLRSIKHQLGDMLPVPPTPEVRAWPQAGRRARRRPRPECQPTMTPATSAIP